MGVAVKLGVTDTEIVGDGVLLGDAVAEGLGVGHGKFIPDKTGLMQNISPWVLYAETL